MCPFLVVLSVLSALIGLVLLSQATAGVGVLALGILFAIWARLHQAREHHENLKRELGQALGMQTRELLGKESGWLSSKPSPKPD